MTQKTHGSCVLPTSVLSPRLGELILNGHSRTLHPNQLLFDGLPPSPGLSCQCIGCCDSECCAVKVFPSCQSHIAVDWSLSCRPTCGFIFTSQCLHLCCGACQAFSHVPPGGCRSCFMCLRGSVVGLVLTVQNTCGVLNPVQGRSHFLCLCLCMRVCFCCFYGSSGIKAHVIRTAVKILCSPIASFAPWVALLPPVKC